MQLTCPSCGAQIAAADINLDRSLAKCARCNAVFDFSDQVGGASGRFLRRPAVDLPPRFTSAYEGAELVITRRWFSPVYLFTAFFALFWNGFLCFWYATAIIAGSWPALLFPLLHVAAGVFITYITLAGFLNRTTVRVSPGLLDVRHGPLPWRGNRQVDPSTLAQLYVTERLSRSRRSTSVSYQLRARTTDDRDESLIEGLETPEQGFYLEQELERRLGIADAPVRGEFGRA